MGASTRVGVLFLGLILVAACSSSSSPSPSSVEVASPTAASPTAMLSVSPSVSATTFKVPPVKPTESYNSKDHGFQFEYPGKWTVQDAGGTCKLTVCVFAPAQDGQVPAAIAVNVITWNTPTNLQTAWNTQRQSAINSWGVQPRTVAGTQGNTTLAGQQAKTATYTLNWGLFPATARQTMILNSEGTSATILSEISSTSIWSDLEPTFTQVEDSFTVSG